MSIVIITGGEEFLMERSARDEASSMLADIILEYDERAGLSGYLEELSCRPVDEKKRAFIIWSATSVPPVPPDPDSLIVVSSKKIDYVGPARRIDFPKLKTFDDKNEVVSWIIKEGDRLGLDLRRVAQGLYLNSRRSLRKLASEIRKLKALVPSGPVGPEDVRSVLPYSADLTPKEIVEAVCEGHPVKAIAFLDRLQEAADETGWIIAFFQRHAIQQLRADRMFAAGLSSGEVAKAFDMHPFYFRKLVEPRVGLWGQSSLVASLNELCRLDMLQKRGDQSAAVGLEAEIVRLSEEAKKNVNRSRVT